MRRQGVREVSLIEVSLLSYSPRSIKAIPSIPLRQRERRGEHLLLFGGKRQGERSLRGGQEKER